MEFAWNTGKNKMSDVKGKEKEQNREGKISNNEIDLDKTHLNYDLVESNKNLYQRVKLRVEEVRPVSRIQKNSVVDYSNIITVPKEQFENWGIEKSKEYLKEVYNYFCKEFGKENVVSAKIHLDETSPHMHLHFVPVSDIGKLQARSVMTPARINKIHTEAPKYLQEKGFDVERGTGKTEKSLEIHRFKAEKLKEDINALEYELKALTGDLKGIEATYKAIDGIEYKKSPLGAKISLKEDDFIKLIDISKKGVVGLGNIERLKSELARIESKSSGLGDENKNLKKDVRELKNENKDLKLKVNKANKIIGSLSSEFKNEFLKAKKEIEAPKPKVEKPKLKSRDLDR